MAIPKDPMILLSYLNTRLRDDYHSLAELCRELELDCDVIEKKMEAIDYRYDENLNRFL